MGVSVHRARLSSYIVGRGEVDPDIAEEILHRTLFGRPTLDGQLAGREAYRGGVARDPSREVPYGEGQ